MNRLRRYLAERAERRRALQSRAALLALVDHGGWMRASDVATDAGLPADLAAALLADLQRAGLAVSRMELYALDVPRRRIYWATAAGRQVAQVADSHEDVQDARPAGEVAR